MHRDIHKSSCLQAQTLRSQKEQLEAQIAEAEAEKPFWHGCHDCGRKKHVGVYVLYRYTYVYVYIYVMIIVCLPLFIHLSCTMCFTVRIWRFAIIAAQCRTGCQCQPSKFMGSPARSPALSLLGSRCPLTFASWCCSTSLDATTVLFVSHTDTACSGTTEWTGRIAVGGWVWGLRPGQGLVCKAFFSERGELSFLSPSTLESLKNIKPRQT